MRVLQTNFHRGWGGQPARILMMSRGLADLGWEVTIAAPEGSILAGRARAAGLATFERCAFRKPRHFLSAARDLAALTRHLRERSYDLVDAHGSQDLWTAVLARAAARLRLPLVFTRHNTKFVAAHAANRWLYRRVDRLIVASRSVLDRYDALLRKGALTPDRVSVIHSAYRTERFHPGLDRAAARRTLGLEARTPLVGAVGRLVPDKGQDDLLRAAAVILRTRPEARFLLVGTGTSEPDLRRLAASLGIEGSVRFLGFRDDVPDLTAALDVAVLASVDCDASPAVLKEALACGVPAVATAIGGAAEILRDGATGLIVPPRDPGRLAQAILSLLGDPDRAREMGRRGSADVAERFAPARLASETAAVYSAVIERAAHRSSAARPSL